MNETNSLISKKRFDWLNIVCGGLVFWAAFIVFYLTCAPTFSFWDCGEFVACAYILGIPHPPGSPLFVMLGRVFSLLPIATDIAVRINLNSVLSSALAAWMGYRIVRRLILHWASDPENNRLRYWAYLGGVVGGLTLAFSNTFWSNAVEAEVYGVAMFLFLWLTDLALLWYFSDNEVQRERLLYLIGYLAVLSTGIHLTTFIVFPALLLFFLFVDSRLRLDLRFWITGIVLGLIIFAVTPFLVALGIWTAVSGLGWLINSTSRAWRRAFMLCCLALLAFSGQLYIPIRSSHNPAIDENDPHDWRTFKAFLERKQYGQGSMITRMFHRRGSLANQFGTHERMGFWGFFQKQYGLSGLKFLPLFALGLFGGYCQFRRRPLLGLLIFILLLLGTVGLVFYMNFADGTHLEINLIETAPLEVRDRDYFWTPGFIWFALFIGLGIAGAGYGLVSRIQMINSTSSKDEVTDEPPGKAAYHKIWPRLVGALVSVTGLLLPVLACARNWTANSAARNYLPLDYAYNMLRSCDRDAVLFTGGDNDTFPLWAAQQVYKIRTDVRVINLSLINTDWYILQNKHHWKVPISIPDQQIRLLRPYIGADNKVRRIQDQIIDNILETDRWRTPIYFAMTCGSDNRVYQGQPLDEHLVIEGLALRVVPHKGTNMVNPQKMTQLLWNDFRYRGVNDPKVYKDENEARVAGNYSALFLFLADTLKRAGDIEGAIRNARRAVELVPNEWLGYAYLVQIFAETGRFAQAESVVAACPVGDSDRLYLTVGYNYQRQGNLARAEQIFRDRYQKNRDSEQNLRALMGLLYQQNRFVETRQILGDWVRRHPENTDLVAAYNEIEKLNRFPGPDTTAVSPQKPQ